MLWSLCDALGSMGMSVVVLDGSATESMHNPGLRQILLRPNLLTTLVAETTPWTVMPAADGLEQVVAALGQHGSASVLLGELFAHTDVVLLYAPTPLLVALLPDASVHPLLTLDADAESLLANYQSYKQIVLQTLMQPAVAAINVVAASEGPSGATVAQALRRCAHNFLGREPDWVALDLTSASEDESGDDVVRLASRLLEIAPALRHNVGVRKDH